jgi:UDP-glucose 4-epimerase
VPIESIVPRDSIVPPIHQRRPSPVLVTGGAGFIGSHLVEFLLEAGHAVTVLDDLSTGQLQNLERILGHPRLGITIGSVLDDEVLRPLVDETEIVFHLAASVGVERILAAPRESIENNLFGTAAVLRAAAKARQTVVLASSSEVYGKGHGGPARESDDSHLGSTSTTRWSYACAKALDEFLGLAYWRDEALPVVVVRYFNVIGPRQSGRYGMVVPRFVRQALAGAPLTVHGNGRQTRCFTDVRDAVRCTHALAMHPAAPGTVFNVGSDREVAIVELAARIRTLCGSASPVEFVPYDRAYGPGYEDLARRLPDLERTRALVGYRPRFGLDETLERVIAEVRGEVPATTA